MSLKNTVQDFRNFLALAEGKDTKSWKKIREKVNDELNVAGLDGNRSFASVGQALAAIGEVLAKNGLEWDETLSANLFRGDKGNRTLHIAWSNPEDSFSPTAIDNSMVAVQWYKHPSGNFEVTAYLS